MSTSRAYLRKRLADIGRQDLLEAADAGLVSVYACAEEAGLVRRREVLGTGSPNAAKRRAWAVMRVTGQAPALPPPKLKPEGTIVPSVQPKFSQETRDCIERLVAAGRADLVIAVTERRLSPFQAARIAERGGRRRLIPEAYQKPENQVDNINLKTEPAEPAAAPVEPEPKKKLDVAALIG